MKLMSVVFVASVLSPVFAAAASFDLSTVKSVVCVDVGASFTEKVYFTTDNAAAKKYLRRDNTIPYDYGNTQLANANARSGQMVVANEPDLENGVIALVDDYDPAMQSSLILTPRDNGVVGDYRGQLTGSIETAKGWEPVKDFVLGCTLTMTTPPTIP